MRGALRRLLRPFLDLMMGLLRNERERLSRQLLFDVVMGFVVDCKVEGCYMEFGSAEGGSLADAFDAASRTRALQDMQFLVFDSFEGLPEPRNLDAGEFQRYGKGDFACNVAQFRHNARAAGVDLSRLTCVPGWYDQTLTEELKKKLSVKKAAVVLIDCDLYESTVPVLNFITEYLQDGTILIFDDWFSYKGRLDLGEARAFKEWLAEHPWIQATEYHKVGRTMISFIMRVERRLRSFAPGSSSTLTESALPKVAVGAV